MSTDGSDVKLVTNTTVSQFFHASVSEALTHQRVAAHANTVRYVVAMLTRYVRAEKLYEQSPDGPMLTPLAMLYAQAIQGESSEARSRALRRLGDVALFIAGLFAESLNRRVVDVDYYIAMGGGAYGCLSSALENSPAGSAMSDVYAELSAKFVDFVDVLAEVGDGGGLSNDSDVLRAYDLWVRTGSARARQRLERAGIHPSESSISRLQH